MRHPSLRGEVEHTAVHLSWGVQGGHLSHVKAQKWEVRDDARGTLGEPYRPLRGDGRQRMAQHFSLQSRASLIFRMLPGPRIVPSFLP